MTRKFFVSTVAVAVMAGSLVALGGLVGCSSTATTSSTPVAQGAISLCNAAGNALTVLASARAQGKLSAKQVAEVHDAETLTDPVCTAPTPPSDAVAAARAFATGLAALVSLQMQVKP
jgi:hypothetical protein